MNVFIPLWLIHMLETMMIPVAAAVITMSAYVTMTGINAIRANGKMYKQAAEQPDGRPCMRCHGTGVEQ